MIAGEVLGAFGLTEAEAGSDAGQHEHARDARRRRARVGHRRPEDVHHELGHRDDEVRHDHRAHRRRTRSPTSSSTPARPASSCSRRTARWAGTPPTRTSSCSTAAACPRGTCSARAARASRRSCRHLDGGRIAIAALALGMAQACLDASVAYANERQRVRRADRPLPVDRVQVRRHGGRGRERAQSRVQGRVAARAGPADPPRPPRWRSCTRARSR